MQESLKKLELVTFPSKILSQQTELIKNPLDFDIQKIIPQMFEIMKEKKGIGLASPQIGLSFSLVVIEIKDKKLVLINPKITDYSEKKIIFPEGCLSFPDKELPIARYEKITAEYLNEFGKKRKIKTGGLLSIAFQHEIDHLNGILIIDRFNERDRVRADRAVPDRTPHLR